jgi:hypothetical protein
MPTPEWRTVRIKKFNADREVAPIEDGLARHDPAAVDAALAYLERDAREHRSGYAKQRLVDKLRPQTLDRDARQRVTDLAVRATREGFQGAGREYARLVRRHATNALRRELRARMYDEDPNVSWRAVWLLAHIKQPGLTDADVTRAQAVIVRERAADRWNAREIASRFWTTQWQRELAARSREERELGARRLLDDARQRELMKDWRASRRRESAARSAEAPSEDES